MKKINTLIAASALAVVAGNAAAATTYEFDYTFASQATLDGNLSAGTGEIDQYVYPDGSVYIYDGIPSLTSSKTGPQTITPVSGTGNLVVQNDGSAVLTLGAIAWQNFTLADDFYSTDWGQILTGSVTGTDVSGLFSGTGSNNCLDAAGIACTGAGIVGGSGPVSPLMHPGFGPQTISFDALAVGGTASFTGVMQQTQPDGSLVANTSVLTFEITSEVSEVPVPAAAWLFGSALVGLAGIGRKRKVA